MLMCVCVYVLLSVVKEEESDPHQCGRHSSGEETALLLPEHTDTVLRYNLSPQTHIIMHRINTHTHTGRGKCTDIHYSHHCVSTLAPCQRTESDNETETDRKNSQQKGI